MFNETRPIVSDWRGIVVQPQSGQQPKKKKDFWTDQISTAGGILGGIGGSFLSPIVGTVSGAAAGSALGEALENALMGENLGNNVAKEALLGGVFSTPPIKAGKAIIGAVSGAARRGGTEVAEQAAKTSSQSRLTDVGNKLLTSQYGTIGKPVARANNPEQTFGELANYGLTKPGDVERVARGVTGANGLISKAVSKAVGEGQRVPTSGLQQIFDDAVELNGLVDKDAAAVQSVFRAQMKKLMGGPAGSLQDAHPSDVLDAMRALEKRAANLSGKGGNYRMSTPERTDQAKALMIVRDELEDRLYNAVGQGKGLSNVLTPEFRESLVGLHPGNKQWQQYVDDTVLKSGDVGSLRSSMAPFVRAKNVIDEADVNSMTFGGRVGNAAPVIGGAIGNALDPITGALAGAAQSAVRTPIARAAATGLRSAGGQGMERAPSRFGIGARVGLEGIGSATANQAFAQQAPPEAPTELSLEDTLMSQSQAPQEVSPYSREALMSDIQRDPKNADGYLKTYQELQDIYAPPKPAKLSATQQETAARASNAMNDLQTLAGAIEGGDINRTIVPGSQSAIGGKLLGTTDIEAALFNIGDVILRSRTGAQAPESEVRKFVSGFLPRAGESKESQFSKLQRAYRELQGMVNPTPSSGSSDLESALLALGGP